MGDTTATADRANAELLVGLDSILATVRARAAEVEAARRIPSDLAESFRRIGLFRMLVPASHGGLGVDFPTSVEVIRSLAKADGAIGWSLMINVESPQLLALLPRSAFEEIYAGGPDVTIAGAFAPKGAARRVDGGYVVTGRWPFASSCEHSDLLFANCVIPPQDDSSSVPTLRCMVAPRQSWTIHDTWDTLGMRGTGSHDISLEGAFVDEAHTFDLFGGTPCLSGPAFGAPLLQFSLHIGAVALGIAEGAHAESVELAAGGRTRLYGRTPLAESELFQHRLGRAEADLRAAHALLFRQVDEFWTAAIDGSASLLLLPRVLQTVGWVVETATHVVDGCYRVSGGSAAYRSSPLERRLRDIHTLSQHASVQEMVFANAGAILLGITPPMGI
jgi:alkylation response protein AidB-like acyl-CoA dehydrogenase